MSPPQTLARHLASISLVLLTLAALPASAVPILTVTAGDDDAGSILIAPGTDAQALAAGFELASAFSDVSVSASLTCLQCQAEFFLMREALGPGIDGGFIDQPTALFSGLDLDIGTYFLVMALTNDTVSGAVWSATNRRS